MCGSGRKHIWNIYDNKKVEKIENNVNALKWALVTASLWIWGIVLLLQTEELIYLAILWFLVGLTLGITLACLWWEK